MAAPVLTSVSPSFGPPGTAITVLGAGFDAGARVGCPSLVDTEYVSEGELRGAIPASLSGADGTSLAVVVYVRNEDGLVSNALQFSVRFGAERLQGWTDIDAVCGEVPGFKRGGKVADATIEAWIRSIAQTINGAMLRRGLSLDPKAWQKAEAASAMPDPASVLELINRYGAAARLASAVGAQFSAQGEWSLAKNLRADFERELKALTDGAYDKLFRPSAATIESGRLAEGGDVMTSTGDPLQAFTKGQIF